MALRSGTALLAMLLASPAVRAAEPVQAPEARAARPAATGASAAKKPERKPAGRAAAPIVWEPPATSGRKERPRPALDLGGDEPTEVVRAGRCGG